MRKKVIAALLCVIISLPVISCGSPERIASSNTEVENLQVQIDSLTKENEELQKQIKEYEEKGVAIEAPDITATEPSDAQAPTPPSASSLGIGETWSVDGQWELIINGVSSTDERNEYSDKNPGQVIILDYTYTNIGYTNEIQDLFISDGSMQIIDENGEIATSYPGNVENNPTPIPVGATCANAQVCIGLNNPSSEIKIICSQYDSNQNKQSVTFILPVQ